MSNIKNDKLENIKILAVIKAERRKYYYYIVVKINVATMIIEE